MNQFVVIISSLIMRNAILYQNFAMNVNYSAVVIVCSATLVFVKYVRKIIYYRTIIVLRMKTLIYVNLNAMLVL